MKNLTNILNKIVSQERYFTRGTPSGVEQSGACCFPFGCSMVSEAHCTSMGGTYLGHFSSCDPYPCGDYVEEFDCVVPKNRKDCLEEQAILWIRITTLLGKANSLGCGLVGLLTRDDRWGDLQIDCKDLDDTCLEMCENLNDILNCLSNFDCPPEEGCCCVRWFETLSIEDQKAWIEEYGYSDDLWDRTWCSHDTEDWCDGEFYPGTSEEGCGGLECPPDCPNLEHTGACCVGVSCGVMTYFNCNAAKGFYRGDDSDCSGDPCGTDECDTSEDCPEGASCKNGSCVPDDGGGEGDCETSSDCRLNYICVDGKCVSFYD